MKAKHKMHIPIRAMWMGLLALGVLVLNRAEIFAYTDTISSNNATAMVIRITPNADRGVQISTSLVHLNLGSVDLSASTKTVTPATVTITGNMINCELELSASMTGGWSFDPNTETTTSSGTNILGVFAQFTSVSTQSSPTQGYEYFRVGSSSGSKLIASGNSYGPTAVGNSPGSGTGMFENNEAGSGDMDSMSPGAVRHLWTSFSMPPTTSITGNMDINFVLSLRDP